MLMLGIATIVALHVVNIGVEIGGGTPPLAIGPILTDLRADPAETSHAWIYFILFSTLAPSLINLVIASAALVSWAMPFKNWLAARIEGLDADPKGESAVMFFAPLHLTVVPLIGLSLVIAACYVAGTGLFMLPGFGRTLLDGAELIANKTEPVVRSIGIWLDRLVPN